MVHFDDTIWISRGLKICRIDFENDVRIDADEIDFPYDSVIMLGIIGVIHVCMVY